MNQLPDGRSNKEEGATAVRLDEAQHCKSVQAILDADARCLGKNLVTTSASALPPKVASGGVANNLYVSLHHHSPCSRT
jgi:hypothetical protein